MSFCGEFIDDSAHAVRICRGDERCFDAFDGAVDTDDRDFFREDRGIQIEVVKGHAGIYDQPVKTA